jgi:hypothetical protein
MTELTKFLQPVSVVHELNYTPVHSAGNFPALDIQSLTEASFQFGESFDKLLNCIIRFYRKGVP